MFPPSCAGQSAVWWPGVARCWRAGRVGARHISAPGGIPDPVRADAVPAMLLLGFLAQYLPWVLVPRSTFIYHYSQPALCDALLVWAIRRWKPGTARATRWIELGYMGCHSPAVCGVLSLMPPEF